MGQPVLFRPPRELLADAMREVTTVASKAELAVRLRVPVEAVTVKPYGYDGTPHYDDRIGWHTYIVMARHADGSTWVEGFTNGPLD